MKSAKPLLLLLCFSAAAATTADAEGQLSAVLAQLNWKSATVFGGPRSSRQVARMLMVRGISAALGRRRMNGKEVPYPGNSLLLLATGGGDQELEWVEQLMTGPVFPHSVLLYSPSVNFAAVKDRFKTYNHSRCFMLSNGLVIKEFQTFRGQDMVTERTATVRRNQLGYGFSEYNLQGAKLIDHTLTWNPWLELFGCAEDGACKRRGIVNDVVTYLVHMFNFTIVTSKSDGWGSSPVTGTYYDDNATFNGALGDVIYGHSDLSLSTWTPIAGRDRWMQFTVPVTNRKSGIIINKKFPPVDATLFVRPFTLQSWKAILGFLLILFTLLLVLWTLRTFRVVSTELESYKLGILAGWIFFILVNAFFSGALTMFFTSAPRIPFSSMRQGLLLYPDWKMIFVKPSLVNIQTQVENGDPIMKKYWDILQSPEGKKLMPPTTEDCINKLTEPGYFLYTTDYKRVLKLAKNMDLDDKLQLMLVSTEGDKFGVIPFARRSPYVPMFNKGLMRLLERGPLELLTTKPFSSLIEKETTFNRLMSAAPLDLSQMGVVISSYAIALVLVIATVLGEHSFKRLMGHEGKRRARIPNEDPSSSELRVQEPWINANILALRRTSMYK